MKIASRDALCFMLLPEFLYNSKFNGQQILIC